LSGRVGYECRGRTQLLLLKGYNRAPHRLDWSQKPPPHHAHQNVFELHIIPSFTIARVEKRSHPSAGGPIQQHQRQKVLVGGHLDKEIVSEHSLRALANNAGCDAASAPQVNNCETQVQCSGWGQ
jgi:hypothetical protein